MRWWELWGANLTAAGDLLSWESTRVGAEQHPSLGVNLLTHPLCFQFQTNHPWYRKPDFPTLLKQLCSDLGMQSTQNHAVAGRGKLGLWLFCISKVTGLKCLRPHMPFLFVWCFVWCGWGISCRNVMDKLSSHTQSV